MYNPLPGDISFSIWLISLAIGFTMALGNFTLLMAFASGGKASIIVPIAGLYPLVSIPIAILAFRERPSGRESMGIILALAAVLLLSLHSKPAKTAASPIKTDDSL
jgi:drug/metabolite transporter (DMT)-like permease